MSESKYINSNCKNHRFRIRVQPRASRDEVSEINPGYFKVRVTPPPSNGKANMRVIELLAKRFGVSKSRIEIVKGKLSKEKEVRIL